MLLHWTLISVKAKKIRILFLPRPEILPILPLSTKASFPSGIQQW